jgi:hypothetical protein
MVKLNEKTIDAYKQKIQAQVKEMKAQTQLMEAKAQKSSADARISYQKKLDDLKARFKDVEVRLKRFSNSTQDTWNEIRTGIDKSMTELHNAVESAGKQLGSAG